MYSFWGSLWKWFFHILSIVAMFLTLYVIVDFVVSIMIITSYCTSKKDSKTFPWQGYQFGLHILLKIRNSQHFESELPFRSNLIIPPNVTEFFDPIIERGNTPGLKAEYLLIFLERAQIYFNNFIQIYWATTTYRKYHHVVLHGNDQSLVGITTDWKDRGWLSFIWGDLFIISY